MPVADPPISEVEAPSVRGKTRQELGSILNSDEIREKLHNLVDETLKLTGTQWGYCPNCKKKVTVEVADLKGRIDGMIKLLEQAEGKPRDEEAGGTTIVVERPPRT